jgi:hypothetical protein
VRLNDVRVSLHFSLREFECPCCHRVRIHPLLVLRLEELRGVWGRPLLLTSGYRCDSHNSRVGGVPKSDHRLGLAADVAVAREDQESFVLAAADAHFHRILPNGAREYVHLAVDAGGA